jgi:diguanylate cyclase (GGDEF)-like protein/PAS domain S-box-containing protein
MFSPAASVNRQPRSNVIHGRLGPLLLAALVLIVALLGTYWIWQRALQQDLRALQADFDFRVRETAASIDQRMTMYAQVLRSAQGLIASSKQVTREEFRTYIAALHLDQHFPGIQAIAISTLVPDEQKEQHIASMRKLGYTDYIIRPRGEREMYAPVTQIEPATDLNLRALGFDLSAEPVRHAAMLQARASGMPTASGKIKLITELGPHEQPGFAMYLPLYRPSMPTETVAQRQAATFGWVAGAFRMYDLMAGIGGERAQALDIRIYDGAVQAENLLFHNHSAGMNSQQAGLPLFQAVQQIDIGNRSWTLAAASRPFFDAALNTGKPDFIAAAGSSAAVMLALLVWLLASGRSRALSLARNMTEELRESEKWLNLALDAAQLGVFDWDLAKDAVTRSPRHDQIFGHATPIAHWSLQTYLNHVLPKEREAIQEKIKACWQEGRVDMVFRIVQPTGRLRWIATKGIVLNDPQGQPVRQIGTIADITELKEAEEQSREARNTLEVRVQQRTAALVMANELLTNEIQEREKVEAALFSSRRRLSLIFDTVAEGLIVYDRDGRIIECNAAANRILGLPVGRLAHDRALDREVRAVHEDGSVFPSAAHPALVSLRTARPARDVVMGICKADGALTWISINTEPLLDEDGQVQMVVANFSDITRKKQSEELIWKQANFDSLTGLPNRRLFQDHLEQEMRKASRSGLPLALMFLDLDRFKDVNDTLGHDTGDLLLKEAAQRLSSCVRESDIVARLGGDEFTVVLGSLQDVTDVVRIAQGIQQKMTEPFALGIETIYISASIGITLYPEDADGIDSLLKNADQAMYAAKNQGRNCYHYFTKSMQDVAQARMWLASELRMAVASRQFTMLYQPIVDLTSGAISKAEALLRWQHPSRGMIDPEVFIPIAEETGLIVEIGDWVLREVADQAKHWRANYHPDFQISVNNSPVQFQHKGNSYQAWLGYLKTIDLPGESIALEITEGLLLDASANVSELLLAFRDAGIHVSLDDFGTGYSSLAYLKKFDIDILKIDQSFVTNLTHESDEMAMCEAIIVMAHKLNLKVVAEGVETVRQRDLLAAAGCDYAQGFLFSKPLPAEAFAG